MQLIMDAEPTSDIKKKMTTLEEPLDTNLKDPIETIKHEIINGNKENIESQQNMIGNTIDAVNGDNLKSSDDSSKTPSPETIDTTNKVDKPSENLDIRTQDILTEQIVCEANNGNGIQDVQDSDEIEQTSIDNGLVKDSKVEKNIKEGNMVQENIITEEIDIQDNSVKLKASQEPDNLMNNEEPSVEENVENTSLSNKKDTNMDIECVNTASEKAIFEYSNKDRLKTDSEEAILEVDNNMDTEPVKVVTEIKNLEGESNMDTEASQSVTKELVIKEDSNIDTETEKTDTKQTILDDNSGMETENFKATNPEREIKINNSQKSNLVLDRNTLNEKDNADTLMDTDDAEITEESIKTNMEIVDNIEKENVTEELEMSNSEPEKIKERETELPKVFEVFDAETGENSVNDAVTKTLQMLDTELDESHVLENAVVSDVSNKNKSSTEIIPNKEDVLKIKTHETSKINDESVTAIAQKDTSQTCKENPKMNSVDSAMVVSENVLSPKKIEDKGESLDIDQFLKDTEVVKDTVETEESVKEPILKLSNTLDILSDDDEDSLPPESKKGDVTVNTTISIEKQCINIEDDDDIMLIDEDTDSKDGKREPAKPMETEEKKKSDEDCAIDLDSTEIVDNKKDDETLSNVQKDSPVPENQTESTPQVPSNQIKPEEIKEQKVEEPKKPLLAEHFLKGCKKNLAEMTRDELEEFCITKIVEGIVDRSNLGDIRVKLKAMAQNIEEYKKKAMMLTKQNRDLQLVLKSVQEEQKKNSDTAIIPLKITRSVGMQVLMTEKHNLRKKGMSNSPINLNNSLNNKMINSRNSNQSPRPQKVPANTQHIPVPRLVPAVTNPTVKTPNAVTQPNTNTKTSQSGINGLKVTTSPVQKTAEKRTFNRTHAVTVDLTEDEPPTKVTPRSSPAPPVRLVSPQNLLTRPQFTSPSINSPRKVYIPISGPQGQNIRPGQTIMLKSVPPPGQRMRGPAPHSARLPQNQVRLTRIPNNRHPAPLPECMKQYQPPNWKALPPAPDLKLSKVENGIVISWKIEGYQEDSYEEIASYQLYAYQETSSPPNTALWKKIGDVKALPLPMACTLTQFMAGFKYYFAVRAVDIRSRLGPFSLPGSILLLNKM